MSNVQALQADHQDESIASIAEVCLSGCDSAFADCPAGLQHRLGYTGDRKVPSEFALPLLQFRVSICCVGLRRDPNPDSPLNCDAGNLLSAACMLQPGPRASATANMTGSGDLRGFQSMARMPEAKTLPFAWFSLTPMQFMQRLVVMSHDVLMSLREAEVHS